MAEKLTEPQRRALALLDSLPPGTYFSAYAVAERAGWNPRAAGAKLAGLERRRLVERKELARGGGKYCVPVYGWRLTDRGREVLRAMQSDQRLTAPQITALEAVESLPETHLTWLDFVGFGRLAVAGLVEVDAALTDAGREALERHRSQG